MHDCYKKKITSTGWHIISQNVNAYSLVPRPFDPGDKANRWCVTLSEHCTEV